MSVRTWGLGGKVEGMLPPGLRKSTSCFSCPLFVPRFQLATADVISVGKALGVNTVAAAWTAVAGWDGTASPVPGLGLALLPQLDLKSVS